MTTLDPRELIADIDRAAGRFGIDVAAVVAELGVVLGVVGGLLGAGTDHARQQRRRTVGVGQAKVRTLAELALVDAEREVVQQVRLDHVVGVEAPVTDVAELLEGFGQRTGDRSDQRIAVEVLSAEHAAHAQLVVDDVVALDRVDALPGARRTRAVVARAGVVEDGRGIVGHRQFGKDRFRHGADAVRTDDVQNAVALHARAVGGVGDDIAAGVERIVQRHHLAGGVGVAAEVPLRKSAIGRRSGPCCCSSWRANARRRRRRRSCCGRRRPSGCRPDRRCSRLRRAGVEPTRRAHPRRSPWRSASRGAVGAMKEPCSALVPDLVV